MVLNTCEMWSNGIKMAFFFQKLIKIAQRLGALPPDPHIAFGGPQTPLCDTFEYTSLLNTSPKFDLHFPTISFPLFLHQNPG